MSPYNNFKNVIDISKKDKISFNKLMTGELQNLSEILISSNPMYLILKLRRTDF